jgi:hypothetical protein
MQPIAVQLITLQQVMPDVTLRLGQSLLARVADRHGDRGILMIAGQPLVAQLPEHVRAGDVLKLAVRDITAEQVVMQMHEGKEAAQAQARQDQPAVPLAFPGQLPSQIRVDDDGSSGGEAGEGDVSAVALTYESPALGEMNFRIAMDGTRVVVEVRTAAGAPLEVASAAAGALESRLAAAVDRAASVTVAPRPGSFDVSA